MGATLGSAFANVLLFFFPDIGIGPSMYAVAGMAGMISGATGAVLTAITMLFEMTRDYNAVFPIVVTVAISYLTRMSLSKESIYTLKLLRRGHVVHEGLQAAVSSARLAEHIMTQDFKRVALSDLSQHYFTQVPFVIEDNGKVVGVLEANERVSKEAINGHFVSVDQHIGFLEVLRRMQHQKAEFAIVYCHPTDLSLDNFGWVSLRQKK